MNLSPSVLEKCEQRFREEPDLLAVWGIGSAFSGRLRDDSDVDFALLYKRDSRSDTVRLGKLSVDLESILGMRVDLGRLSTRNLVYTHQAISAGTLLYQRSPELVHEFVGRALSLYLDLKQDRKEVEEAYRV